MLKVCNKIHMELSLFQAKQSQLFKLVFIAEVLYPSDHLHGSPLDSLKPAKIPLDGVPSI